MNSGTDLNALSSLAPHPLISLATFLLCSSLMLYGFIIGIIEVIEHKRIISERFIT